MELFPGVRSHSLTGGGVFSDGQMYNPTRLALGLARSAVDAGAVAVNYAQATRLIRSSGKVQAVEVQDLTTGTATEVRTRSVLNAAGPWVPWMKETNGLSGARAARFPARSGAGIAPYSDNYVFPPRSAAL